MAKCRCFYTSLARRSNPDRRAPGALTNHGRVERFLRRQPAAVVIHRSGGPGFFCEGVGVVFLRRAVRGERINAGRLTLQCAPAAGRGLYQSGVIESVLLGLVVGEDRLWIAEAIGNRVPVTLADDLNHAIRLASRWAQPGDAVLFSPACASFDMFKNFEHRGDVYRQLVQELIA